MQYQLAEQLGYCNMTINLIEQGKNLPSEKLLQKIISLICKNDEDINLLYDAYSYETRKFPCDTTDYFKEHSDALCNLIRHIAENKLSDEMLEALANSI